MAAGRGEAGGDEYGESVPRGGMPSGNPVAVAFMNFARATVRDGEDQTGEAGAREGTARRKRSLAHSRGGAFEDSVCAGLITGRAPRARWKDRVLAPIGPMGG